MKTKRMVAVSVTLFFAVAEDDACPLTRCDYSAKVLLADHKHLGHLGLIDYSINDTDVVRVPLSGPGETYAQFDCLSAMKEDEL